MNGINFIADTNAIIYLLAGNPCMKSFTDNSLGVSVITEMELLSFPRITEQEQVIIKELLSNCKILYFDNEIKNQAIYLRRFYKIKLPDAIVAATAISYNMPLITADKEFKKIEELNLCLLNPIVNQ